MAKKPKSIDPREWAKRALVNALKRAETADDLPGIVQSARAILAEFPESPPPDRPDEKLTEEQFEERLLHMLNESRVWRGQRPVDVPQNLPIATETQVEAKLRELTARGVRWRLFQSGSLCLDQGWLSEDDLIFILVNCRSEAMRAAHATHADDCQRISKLRDGRTPEQEVASVS